MKQKFAFIDIETTGLDVYRHEIISIGLLLVSQEDGLYEILEEREYKIKPMHIESSDLIALRVNKYNTEEWVDAISLRDALEDLASRTRDAFMVGHNVVFDYLFLDKAFKEHNITNTMHYHLLDTISLAYAKTTPEDQDLRKYSLYHLSHKFGIRNEEPHHALSDTRTTFEIFKKIMES